MLAIARLPRPGALGVFGAVCLLLAAVSGCGSDDGSSPGSGSDSGIQDDGGSPDGSAPDSSVDGGTPDGSTEGGSDAGSDGAGDPDAATEGGADGSTEGGCACDLTSLCDTGCACDVACAIVPGAPPLGHDAVAMDRAEIATFFPSAPAGAIDRVTLNDDAYLGVGGLIKTYPTILPPTARPAMTTTPVAFADDVDDDGRDEPVLVGLAGVTVEDWDGTTLTPRSVHSYASADWYDGAAGDLDGDGGRELVVSHQVGNTVTLDVLSLGKTGTATLRASATISNVSRHGITVAPPKVGATPEIYVLVAKTGPGGTLEPLSIRRFALTGTSLAEGTAMDLTGDCLIDYTTVPQVGVSIAVGNLDADPESELVVADYCGEFKLSPNGDLHVRMIDPGVTLQPTLQLAPALDTRIGGKPRPFLAIGRLGSSLTDPPMIALGSTRAGSGPVAVIQVLRPQLGQLKVQSSTNESTSSMVTGLAVRDLTRDGYDEVVVSRRQLQTSCVPYGGCSISDRGAMVQVYKGDVSAGPLKVVLDASTGSSAALAGPNPVIAVGDFDQDSVRVRATGKVYQHVGPPFVNAVLAAPPTWMNVPGVTHTDASETSFGVTNTSGTADSANISASAGVTLSAGASFLVFEFSASVSATVEVAQSLTQEQTISYGQETSVGPDEDLVLFRVVAYASHEYEVVSHPDKTQIGSLITVDVPGKMIDTVRSLDQFRADFGKAADAVIPPTLFNHKVGDPKSYPGAGSCSDSAIAARIGTGAVSNAYGSPTLVDVGQAASGAKTQTIGMGTQTTSSVSIDLNVEMSVGVSAGVGVEVSTGFGVGHTHETTIGKDVSYSGSVGYLSSGYGPSTRYEWGLCVFHFADDATNPKYGAYPVIDYTVSPY